MELYVNTEVKTVVLNGTQSRICTIESCLARGFSGLQILGVNNETARNGKERVVTTLENQKFKLSNKKIVINCSPADILNPQAHFDLALALTLIQLHNEEPPKPDIQHYVFAGELGLDGRIKPILGSISIVLEAINGGYKGVVLPADNAREIEYLRSLSPNPLGKIDILYFAHLSEVFHWLKGKQPPTWDMAFPESPQYSYEETFDDMYLSEEQFQLALICAVGRHSLLLQGTPGTGKSMFASRIPSILPRPTHQDHIYTLKLYSSVELTVPMSILQGTPPYRSPHHSASAAAILGTPDQPGDLALANGGILFLDEVPEFRRDLLEALREPLETGEVKVSRARKKMNWKAKTLLIAAANRCPCGWLGSKRQLCRCSVQELRRYQRKLSGPLLDRIDIHFNVPEYDGMEKLFQKNEQKNQTRLLEASSNALEFSISRNRKFGFMFNTDIPTKHALEICGLTEEAPSLKRLSQELHTVRSMVKVLRIARTIGDLRKDSRVSGQDIQKALLLRPQEQVC